MSSPASQRLSNLPLLQQDMDSFKPDRSAYNKLRDAAEGNTTGALIASSSSMNTASEDLYRDANSFVYADHKPTEDAIDRVIGSINISYVFFSLLLVLLLHITRTCLRITFR